VPSQASELKPSEVASISRAASSGRFAVFTSGANGDQELACRLYLWDRNVAASILRDFAVAEVALRNALAEQLVLALGPTWYEAAFFNIDRRLKAQRDRALDDLAKIGKTPTSDQVTEQLSLGFWVNLLDAKGSEQLWRSALHKAFPGGKKEAAAAQARYRRAWVLSQLRVMRLLRNRCAHHEPLINGFPLSGQGQRMSVASGIDNYERVVRMLDAGLGDWMAGDTTAPGTLVDQPQPTRKGKP
jgi:hypothetical protein